MDLDDLGVILKGFLPRIGLLLTRRRSTLLFVLQTEMIVYVA